MNKLEKELIIDEELNQYEYITILSTKDNVKLLSHSSYDVSADFIDCTLTVEVKDGNRVVKCETDLFIYYVYNLYNDTYVVDEVSIVGGEILDTDDQNDLETYLILIEDALEVDLTRS